MDASKPQLYIHVNKGAQPQKNRLATFTFGSHNAIKSAKGRYFMDEFENNNDRNIPQWMRNVKKKMEEGDLAGMRQAALPSIQEKIIDLATEAEDERIQLAAGQFVMGQAGQGTINRIEHNINYEKMSEEQLTVLLKSKLEQMEKLCPGFSIEDLLKDTAKSSENKK